MGIQPEGYRTRIVEKRMENLLSVFGGVSIEGPKGCGKTWLGLKCSNSRFMIGDLNDYGQPNRDLVKLNMNIAMEGDAPHLIDEWQEVPQIWDAVRSEIDRRGRKGQFILTGSSTPKDEKPVHSGTGRIKHLRIRTMSLLELGKSSGSVSLCDILSGLDIGIVKSPHTDLKGLVDLVVAGGWPYNLDLNAEQSSEYVSGYLDSIMKDASELDGKLRNVSKLTNVFRSISRNECTVASDARIHKDTDVPLNNVDNVHQSIDSTSYDTVQSYIDIFTRLYLTDDIAAFDPNLKSSVRVGKQKKRHLTDPSLAVAALRISSNQLMNDLKTFGCLFESLCIRDLLIYSDAVGANMYHYRDDNGTEVDAIIELPDGTWGAFEIKLGHNQVESAIENLLKFKEKIEKHHSDSSPSILCVICGLSEYAYMSKEGVYVIPITCLGP